LKQKKDMIEFDLDETIYFENGQEIDEMVSISLEPDIAVHEYESYVQIRGLIILQGEYSRAHIENVSDSYDANVTRHIEKVIELDGDQASFSHRFPVEISVPSHRVNDLNDITVTVDSFDYELPDSNQLKLMASVHIRGINASDEKELSQTDNAEAEGKEEGKGIIPESSMQIEKEESEKQTKEEVSLAEKETSRKQAEKESENKTAAQKMEEADGAQSEQEQEHKEELVAETESEARSQIEPKQDDAVAKQIEQEQETESLSQTEQVQAREAALQAEETEATDADYEEVAADAAEAEEIKDSNEIDIQLSESAEDDDRIEVKDVQFLTDLFGGDEEETYMKMKIYIAQEDDTIESIAKRYEISALELIKDNNLTEESLEEGQLLHIPVKTKK